MGKKIYFNRGDHSIETNSIEPAGFNTYKEQPGLGTWWNFNRAENSIEPEFNRAGVHCNGLWEV